MKILMLCHDRQIDRRIIAQAQSLLELGYEVNLIALSSRFIQKNTEEKMDLAVHKVAVGETLIKLKLILQKLNLTNAFNLFLSKLVSYPKFFRFFLNCYRFKNIFKSTIRYLFNADPLPLVKALFPFYQAVKNEALNFEFDLVQVHDLPLLGVGVELAKLRNVPLVYDSHELFPEQISHGKFWKKILSQYEQHYIKNCHLVFTVNESIAEEMAKRYSIKQPVVLFNALDQPSNFSAQKEANRFRDYFGLSEDKRIVLLQGGLSPHRNLENLVKAFAKVKNPAAVLVIMGSGILEKKLIQIAKKLKLYQTKVYFLPAVPQDELLYYTASADLGVIPYPPLDLNTYYCTPNKLFEFIQAGLPILANDLPELRRFVYQTDFGMVHTMTTPQEIAEAIDIALNQLPAKGWRENIMAKREDYSWQTQAKVYLQAMQQVLG